MFTISNFVTICHRQVYFDRAQFSTRAAESVIPLFSKGCTGRIVGLLEENINYLLFAGLGLVLLGGALFYNFNICCFYDYLLFAGSSSYRSDIVFYWRALCHPFKRIQFRFRLVVTLKSTKSFFLLMFLQFDDHLFTKLVVSMFPTPPCPTPGLYQIYLRSPHCWWQLE